MTLGIEKQYIQQKVSQSRKYGLPLVLLGMI
jgi:hypothetical protein